MRITLIITLLLSSLIAFAGDKKTEVFTLDHQMSQNCEKKIKENLRFEKGINKIEISLKDNLISITFDTKKTDVEKIIEAFKKIGFNAFVYSPEGQPNQPHKGSCNNNGSDCNHCCQHKN